VFERAVAQSSWTRSSMGSIFTGRWPQHHGANDTADRLAERLVTLAEVLLAHGYETAGFTANPLVDHTFGFDQGFTTFASITGEQSFLARSEELQRQALDWLDRRRDPDRPFFLYLHTMDPHEPYDPPADFRARWALPGTPAEVGRVDWLARLRRGDVAPTPAVRDQVRAVYAAEVAANDARLGDWIEALRARGRFDGAIWIVASDHGEAFAEHGHFGHRYGLNEELLRVPLLWKAPEGERGGERSPAVARHVDILPTLLDALGLPPPGTLDGRSLAAADTDSTDPASVAFLETGPVRWTSVTDGRWKLIRSRRRGGPDRVELFDLTRDPDERNDLSTQETGKVEALLATLDASEPEVAPPATGEVEIDPALRTRLEALGYAD
jgi:arylsulfatase